MKTQAIIEIGNDNTFDITLAYSDEVPFGLLGQGNTIEEAKEDFLNSYMEMSELMKQKGIKCPELEFDFLFDMGSFLKYLGSVFSMAGLQKITGINRKQLGHYVQGVSKPRLATAKKIQNSILEYANSISKAQLKF